MKKCLLCIIAICFSLYVFGCGRKEEAMEESEPMSMEALSNIGETAPTMPKAKTAETRPEVTQPAVTQAKLEPLPPAGPYKPTNREIQTALKNANFYTAAVDGVIGPKTKKAIEEFQKANGLKVDGKVGPKTWEMLSKYLNPAPTAPAKR